MLRKEGENRKESGEEENMMRGRKKKNREEEGKRVEKMRMREKRRAEKNGDDKRSGKDRDRWIGREWCKRESVLYVEALDTLPIIIEMWRTGKRRDQHRGP